MLQVMELRSDYQHREVLITADLPWSPSPLPGVDRRMLDRVGDDANRLHLGARVRAANDDLSGSARRSASCGRSDSFWMLPGSRASQLSAGQRFTCVPQTSAVSSPALEESTS